jgi:hypothetical protein
VNTVEPELVIADVVRCWAEHTVPGDPRVAAAAVALAERCYVGGASVAEACEEGRRFVGSWSRHPSRQPVRRLLAAS